MENSAYHLRISKLIFSMFGDEGFVQNEKLTDPETGFKTKEGIFQRFLELIGETADNHILPVIDGLLEQTLVPDNILENFLSIKESSLGIPQLFTDIYKRKKVIDYAEVLKREIGTLPNLRFLFGMLGFHEVNVREVFFGKGQGFDDPTYHFDDPVKSFDFSALKWAEFDLLLSSNPPVQITDEIRQAIPKIILFNTPIHGRLRSVFHNEIDIDVPVYIIDHKNRFIQTDNQRFLTAN